MKNRLHCLFKVLAAAIWVAAAALLFHRAASSQSLVPLTGNHSVLVQSGWTELNDSKRLELKAILELRNRDELTRLEVDLQNRDSPDYHKWLTPGQFGMRFGPTSEQMRAVSAWVAASGLTVNDSDLSQRSVRFTGTYAAIKRMLQTTVLTDGQHYANIKDPMLPANLSGTVEAIIGLNGQSTGASGRPDAVVPPSSDLFFGPSDLYTFYDEATVLKGGNQGTSAPDCIALPELASITSQPLTNFTTQFGLAPISLTTIHVGGADPGLPSDNEPYLDIEWSHVVSPNTPIVMYIGNTYSDALQQAVSDNHCGAISSSVENTCPGPAELRAIDDIGLQAVVQGQTIFHSSGDYGANWYCGNPVPVPYATTACGISQPSVDEQAAGSHLTSVGGTQFAPVYDAAGNDTSTIDDNLETAWNDVDEPETLPAGATPTATSTPGNCPIKDASGGGKSTIFVKPPWQTGPGVPNDGVRDVPDVSMGANGKFPGYWVATQREGDTAPSWLGTGGTSIASPMWAGISRVIAQGEGVTRLGNINARLYELGSLANPKFGLHDITEGNNNDNGVIGYDAGPGFDLVTGWGSPDIALLVAAFPGSSATVTPVSATIAAGASGSAGQFMIANTTANPLQLSKVTVTVGNPVVFSSMSLSATVGTSPPVTAKAVPAANTVFTFDTPVNIPAGASASLDLQVAAGTKPPTLGGLIGPGAGRSTHDAPGSFSGGAVLMLGATLLIAVASRRRRKVALAGLLVCVAFSALIESCGGNTSSRLIAVPTAKPTGTPMPTATATATPTASSRQTLANGAVALSDGQGGIVGVSGLPASLGSVTVRY